MPLRKCAVASCRTKVEIPERFCEDHKEHTNKTYNSRIRFNEENEKYTNFYHSTAWKRVRRLKLMQNPLCEVCEANGRMTKADMVHHIIELRTPIIGWEHRLDLDNLQSICYACHNATEHHHSKNYSKEYKQ